MFIFNGIVTWHCSHHVTPRVTFRTCALQNSIWIWAPLWLQKSLTMLKSVPLMLKRNALGCIIFSIGQIYVCGDTFILCHFVYISIYRSRDRGKVLIWGNPQYFKQGNSLWRKVKRNTYISFNQFILSIIKL